MAQHRRSQASVDLLIIFSMLFAVFLFVFVTINQRDDRINPLKTEYYARAVCDRMAIEINTVFLAGNGATKTVYLVESLKDTTPYSLSVYPNGRFVEVNWNYMNSPKHYSSPIITGNVVGDLTGLNGKIVISNFNGAINLAKG